MVRNPFQQKRSDRSPDVRPCFRGFAFVCYSNSAGSDKMNLRKGLEAGASQLLRRLAGARKVQ
jgi:hypothetical protein